MKKIPAILFGVVVCGAATVGANDVFEQIAGQKNEAVPGLAANPAPKLPDKPLPWDAQSGTGFQPGEKIETQAQLDAELKRMREKYAPFLADLAPALPSMRKKMALEKFDWRLATEMDSNSLLPTCLTAREIGSPSAFRITPGRSIKPRRFTARRLCSMILC
jgi:hypothetical protein